MFVNTIVLRSRPEGTKTVKDFLKEVSQSTLDALEHQEYPYGELVKKLDIHVENRNPLFDVMFAYQSEKMTDVIFGDEAAGLLEIPITTSKYDFTYTIMPMKSEVVLMVEYCTDLYKEKTVLRIKIVVSIWWVITLQKKKLMKRNCGNICQNSCPGTWFPIFSCALRTCP